MIPEVDFGVRTNIQTNKFGRTGLIIGASKATNCEECACDLSFGVAPPKPRKNAETKRNNAVEKISQSKNGMWGIV